MKILITGINGFVGSNLVRALANEHLLYGLDINSNHQQGVSNMFTWNDLNLLPEIDTIIHLAGKAHDTKNQAKAQDYFDINTKLTQKIYDWYLQSNVSKFIFFSSVKAAADKVSGEFLTEDINPEPIGPYGKSKIAAENYILSNLPLDANKNVYIFRPSMIHGPGNKGNLNLLYNFVNKGIPYPLGAFENKRSFTSIDNLSFIIENILQKNIATGVYNIADDDAISTNELIALIAKTINRPTRIWKWNQKLIIRLAQLGTNLNLPLNSDRLQKLTENYVVSNEKIKKALEINNLPIKSKEGLFKTIQYFNHQ